MALQKDYFLCQLTTLRPTEEQLKALAMFLKVYEDDCEAICEGIEFSHGRSSIHHRITLYYLINEILGMKTSERLKNEMKRLVRTKFENDLKESKEFEVLKNRLTELKKIWTSRKMIDFEREGVKEVIKKIEEAYSDKGSLVKVLEDILRQYKQ